MKIMNLKVLAIINWVLLCLFNFSQAQSCDLSEDTVKQQILDRQTIPCLQKAIKNGWQNVIDHLVKHKQNEYQDQFIEVFSKQIKRLQILEEQIVLGQSQTQPFLKWGQNKTHIFITFKLSHRWDSPPCLNTHTQKSQLSKDLFFYNNICLVSHQKINFKVNLNLYRNVFLSFRNNEYVQDTSSTNFTDYTFQVKKDGVGTYSTILLKETPQIWLFLTKQQKIYPLWHQIQTRYPQDFSQYQQGVQAYKNTKKQKTNTSSSQSLQFKKMAGLALFLLISFLLFH